MLLPSTMCVSAEPERSLRARLCVAFFLVWLCHVGRSQVDQWNSPTPTCGKVVNSSAEDLDCNWVARFLYRFCDGDNVTLVTDPVSFVNSTSSVFTQTNFTGINDTMFYYKLCLFYPSWNFFNGRNVLINCTYNETELDLEVEWDTPGWLNLSVAVYREEDMKFLGCAKTSITVAENSGLDLNVSLKNNNPPPPSVNPVPFPPDSSIDVDFLSDGFVRDGKAYPIGNITFTCLTNRTTATTYYKYSFGDEENEPYTLDGNLTHEYSKVGMYEYVVDAVALNGRGDRGFHAAHTGHMYIMEPVSNISMVVNKENTFERNVETQVNISAYGTRPILACWLVQDMVHYSINSPPNNNDSVTPSPSPDYTCKELINQSIFEPMVFTELGEYMFVTLFGNNVSQVNSTITFTVIKNPSKVVVASTSTLVAILAVLIAIVCVLMIVMGLYIPYRKYKTKYTETANFKFVDLSESTNWDRARMKVREFVDKFSRTKQPSKVGLVNEKNESTNLRNFPYESVS